MDNSFPDYPVAGGSHPSLSNDYMSDPAYDGDIKRVAQYALPLLQTDRAAEALNYVDEFQKRFSGYMNQENWFMRSMVQSHFGRLDKAAESMKQEIENAEIPPQCFLAGPCACSQSFILTRRLSHCGSAIKMILCMDDQCYG